ncbi:MAG: hypothetical protein QOG63_2316 [Thermoleophilaceae bacterium]|jgi:hypothetical protein|nr:hypothetical protein [Thermoleophilaceae bacterium]
MRRSRYSGLTELLVLVGVLCAAGTIATWGSPRAFWFAAAALTAGLAAGLELVVREHFTGRCDNSSVLGGALACLVLGGGAWARVPPLALLALAAAAFAVATVALRLTFRGR